MANRKHKLPPDKTTGGFCYRAGKALDSPDGEPIRMVLASENPVKVFDWEQYDVVDEVLRMDGLNFPDQVPLLNSHDRSEARSVIGSIRDLEVRGDKLEGKAYFASNEAAQEIRQLYQEGHLTDFSIGFQADEVVKVKRGESTSIAGRKYAGPVRIVTKARAKEGSAVAIGADDQAKAIREFPALRAYLFPHECLKEHEMDKLRSFCLTRGMPADTPDDEVAQWMEDNLRSAAEEPEPIPVVEEKREAKDASERTRATEITSMCLDHGISSQQIASYIRSDLTSAEVAKDVLRKLRVKKVAPPQESVGTLTPAESEDDKFLDGAKGALIDRCLMGINIDRAEKHARGEFEHFGAPVSTFYRDQTAIEGLQEIKRLISTPVSGAFRTMGLYELAREFVSRDARNRLGVFNRDVTFGRSRTEIVTDALRLDLVHRSDPAYHTTGSFSNLLLDAAKKTLLAAYEEQNVTYPIWTRQAPSTVDFKTINRMRLGELPDPDIVPENGRYGEAAVSDGKETYRVEKYGHLFSISLEAIINDDLNAISRIPAQQGAAMRRKINKVVYAVLTGNAAMSDAVALFHSSSHGGNLDANALSTSALNTGWVVMAVQTGLTSGVVLNLQPRYLLVPPSLSATALQLTSSMADMSTATATNEDAARAKFNSGVVNLYGPSGSRPLVPVVDACISTSESATAWYLAAEPSQIDTVEVCFLQGEETPFLAREDEFCVDSVRYKIRQTFGAKAVDYRGLYQGNS